MSVAKSRLADGLGCVVLFLLCFGVAGIGGTVTAPSIPEWHAHLHKPSFNPPNEVFGPVWTVLYFLMALAASLVWFRRQRKSVSLALGVFLLQLALNLAWTFLFFGWHRIDLASCEIVALVIAIAATVILFARHSWLAASLLIPYLVWVIFASFLCWDFWCLNP